MSGGLPITPLPRDTLARDTAPPWVRVDKYTELRIESDRHPAKLVLAGLFLLGCTIHGPNPPPSLASSDFPYHGIQGTFLALTTSLARA
jgi:hypothetical protein